VIARFPDVFATRRFSSFATGWWNLRLKWAHTALAWWAWAGLACAAVAALALVASQLRIDRAERVSLSSKFNATQAASPSATPPTAARDFTAALPAQVDPLRVLAELEHSATSAAVSLADITIRADPVTADTLGRAELSLHLRGPYLAIRRVIADMTDRFPYVTVCQLQLRHDAASGVAESTLVLSAWSAPSPTPRADERPR
jgi:hypothetical protein